MYLLHTSQLLSKPHLLCLSSIQNQHDSSFIETEKQGTPIQRTDLLLFLSFHVLLFIISQFSWLPLLYIHKPSQLHCQLVAPNHFKLLKTKSCWITIHIQGITQTLFPLLSVCHMIRIYSQLNNGWPIKYVESFVELFLFNCINQQGQNNTFKFPDLY